MSSNVSHIPPAQACAVCVVAYTYILVYLSIKFIQTSKILLRENEISDVSTCHLMLKLLMRLHLQFLPHSHHLLTETQKLSLTIILKRKNREGGGGEGRERKLVKRQILGVV